MVEKPDPQVQIKIIELAWNSAEKANKISGIYTGKTTAQVFDVMYKAMIETIKQP